MWYVNGYFTHGHGEDTKDFRTMLHNVHEYGKRWVYRQRQYYHIAERVCVQGETVCILTRLL